MSIPQRVSPRDRDVLDLILKGYKVKYLDNSYTDNGTVISVKMKGPIGSIYEGGVWQVRVIFPGESPTECPHITFMNRIFHPNVEFLSGVVSDDAIDEQWNSICNLTTIFEDILPKLLLVPRCARDFVMNQEALIQYMWSTFAYEDSVKTYVLVYAREKLNEKIDFVEVNDDGDLPLESTASTMTAPSYMGDFQKEKMNTSQIEQIEVGEEPMELENHTEMSLQAIESVSPLQITENRLTNSEKENDNDLWYEPPLKRRNLQ